MKINATTIYALDCSKKFTELALENGLIRKEASAEDTAKNVITFMETIFENLAPKKD